MELVNYDLYEYTYVYVIIMKTCMMYETLITIDLRFSSAIDEFYLSYNGPVDIQIRHTS